MRWLVLDEVLDIKKGKTARARSRVPDGDYSAEVLMLEMMAQTGGILLGAESDYREDIVFTKIESADFSGDYHPGEPLEISAASDQLKPEGAWVDAAITQGSRPVARSRFMLVNVGQLIAGTQHSLTFHPEFMNHFQIREKLK